MLFSHQHFSLDTDTREVRDPRGEAIRLTGMPYLFLAFLCDRKQAEVVEIAAALGGTPQTMENMRLLRHRVRQAIGHDVITCAHDMCWLMGQVRETDRATVAAAHFAAKHPVAGTAVKVASKAKPVAVKVWQIIAAIAAGVLTLLAPKIAQYLSDRFLSPPAPVVQSATGTQPAASDQPVPADQTATDTTSDPQLDQTPFTDSSQTVTDTSTTDNSAPDQTVSDTSTDPNAAPDQTPSQP